MKQCSLDARSEEQRRAPFQGGYGEKMAQWAAFGARQRAASEGPRWTPAQEMKEMGSLLDFALLYLFGC